MSSSTNNGMPSLVHFHHPRATNCVVRLFCCPHAGAGPAIFAKWGSMFPADVEVWGILLPGRQSRLREPGWTTHTEIISHLLEEMRPLLNKPYLLYAHSFGSEIFHELTLELRRQNLPLPKHLILSSRFPPSIVSHEKREPISAKSDDEFLNLLTERYNYPPINDPALKELAITPLRADFAAMENYQPTGVHEEPLSLPLTVIGGAQETAIPVMNLEGWRQFTRSRFMRIVIPKADHFFYDHPKFLNTIRNAVEDVKAEEAGLP
ncbi:putative beta-ketoacyl synthase [Paratrimastix pyriformis]|uniref:Beta-ketoacyl synthase n=1 Tax=Paratrimastix pyriformis TaxID=342808 RepID=A0ABQ8UV11_9EUKA|nr:putative beta-ketoacyl synthase [Paratrimastix pyriformis]|eukprot:GAFH01002722.1.p1 GENE.GAFH01002722.1~~GAFH01002722.1.p1  ORF type:complete len:264 (-),score=34.10 GAFH01002722.1:292-1083(-)